MKRLLVFMLILLVVVALVACGGETTTAPDTTTDPNGTEGSTTATTVGGTVTTTKPVDTEGGEDTSSQREGTDILNGDPSNIAIDAFWGSTYLDQGKLAAGVFEKHHAQLDYHWSYVMKGLWSENAIFEDLILRTGDGAYTHEMNADYQWVMIIDGKEIVVENFYNYYPISGTILLRLDLGEEFRPKANYGYDITLEIRDVVTEEVVYYAWLTNPGLTGPHYHVAKEYTVPDENRDPDHVLITGAKGESGPEPLGQNELYTNLFDYDLEEGSYMDPFTKLCTEDYENAIVWSYDMPVAAYSYSLIGANDDASYDYRVPTRFKLYGKTADGDWVLIDEQDKEPLTDAVNYAERNFKIDEDKVDMYTSFKLEVIGEKKYQISSIQLFTVE